ncbi:MAG TPA: hypothetical protein VMZ53_02150 [Kofleriaceae bacterium]|nr:hypothetical protein [Kofleriaceae bacterium]
MRLSSLLLLLLPSVALAQAPGETPPSPPPDPAQEPDVHPPAPAPAPEPAPTPEATAAPAPAPTPAPTPAPVASPMTQLTPDAVPEQCKALAKEATGPSINRALSARISLASCLADHKLKPLVLCDCEASVIDINAATQLSIALLDEVFTKGDAAMQILARQAKGDMLSALAQRMQATVPPPVTATPEAIALRDTRLDLLQPMIEPWQTQARAAYSEVDKIAKANPQLSKNAAVVAAVRASRTKLGAQPPATQTATR